jgi:hypothetical protein
MARKLLSSATAYIPKYASALDAHVCLSWWVVFSPVVCCLHVLFSKALGTKTINFMEHSVARQVVKTKSPLGETMNDKN